MGKRRPRTWPEIPAPLAGPVMDNHTHLPVHEGEIPKADGVKLSLEEQIERARSVNITRQISSACELPDFDPMIQIARSFHGVQVSLAIHPNEAALHAGVQVPSPDGLTPIQRDHHIPLDYFRTADEGKQAQKESFAAHIQMAERAGLPLQIHDRNAHDDTVSVLDDVAHADQLIVFHCFSGDGQLADILAKNGWYASFAGPISYPANDHLRQGLLRMPRELVLVETDAPYLTPVPHRGSPNSSYVMAHTVRFIADLWEVSEEEACCRLMENSFRVYGK